jgi:hypothetical protein
VGTGVGEQAVPKSLAPLPAQEVGDYVRERFAQTGRDAGDATDPLLELWLQRHGT